MVLNFIKTILFCFNNLLKILGLMVENTLEDGLMGNNMEKELSLRQMDKKNKVNGKMVSEKDGLYLITTLKWMTLKTNL